MTSLIGSKSLFTHPNRLTNKGFTFIEVMVTLLIMTFSLVAISRIYVSSLGYMNTLLTRLYINIDMNNQICEVERMLRVYNSLPFDLGPKKVLEVGPYEITPMKRISFKEIVDYPDVFEIELKYSWTQSGKDGSLVQLGYISDFDYESGKY